LFRRCFHPAQCQTTVLGDAQTVLVHNRQPVLCFRIAVMGKGRQQLGGS